MTAIVTDFLEREMNLCPADVRPLVRAFAAYFGEWAVRGMELCVLNLRDRDTTRHLVACDLCADNWPRFERPLTARWWLDACPSVMH